MDKPVLIIEMPTELSTEGIIEIRDFLNDLILSFEAHYHCQLRDHSSNISFDSSEYAFDDYIDGLDDNIDDLF
jgi:hypothetical protein